MISKKLTILLISFSILPSVISFFIMFLFFNRVNLMMISNEKSLDSRIETVVKRTLELFKDDISSFSTSSLIPSSKTSDKLSDSNQKVEKRSIKIDGARLSTYKNHFFIDNVPFYLGDVISPYGIAVEIGRDVVIFDDFNGGLVVLGKKLPQSEEKEEKEEKNT